MGTECSYDYLFVYDGDTFSSPLLGSFSGKTEPQQITAKSGFVITHYQFNFNFSFVEDVQFTGNFFLFLSRC